MVNCSPSERIDETVKGLRDMADFFEQHPEVQRPLDVGFYVIVHDKSELVKAARALGNCDKTVDSYYNVQKKFGRFTLQFCVVRDAVCTQRVVGTKTVTTHKLITPAVYQEVEEVVENVAWDCPEALLKEDEDAQSSL